MVRIRHKTTHHELNVPETALKFYANYELVDGAPPAKKTTPRKRTTTRKRTTPKPAADRPSEANPTE